jgi:cytochrome c oxidase cbb3-type subunit 3
MTQKHDELLDHDYDGIREYDNPLPRWWIWLFYGTILFSIVYIPYYLFGIGPTSAEEYEQEMALARAARPPAASAPAPSSVGGGAPGQGAQAPNAAAAPSLAGNAESIAAGKQLFLLNCSPCHGPEGQGGIGPNLTDAYWLHGNRYEDVVNTITNGVPDKGMIAWKATLNPEKINQAAAFVLTLKGTNPPNPKAPQGDKYPD